MGELDTPACCRTEGKSASQDHQRLHQFLPAVVVLLVVALIILIHLVVVIFFVHMYDQLVFLALFTGVLNAIACECRRGMEAGGFQLFCGWRSFLT